MQSRSEIRHLPVELTQKELLQKGQLAAKGVDELKEIEAEKAASSKRFGELVKDKRSLLDKLAHEITTGEEVRPVECFWKQNWREHTMVLYRGDTGDNVYERSMTEAERQLELDVLDRQQTLDGTEDKRAH
jgi:hypothetical protein